MKKKRRLRIALIGCAVLLCLTINARTHPAQRSQGITLWYTEADCPQELMGSALALCRQETGSWVEGVCFPDEDRPLARMVSFNASNRVFSCPPDCGAVSVSIFKSATSLFSLRCR